MRLKNVKKKVRISGVRDIKKISLLLELVSVSNSLVAVIRDGVICGDVIGSFIATSNVGLVIISAASTVVRMCRHV